MMAASQFAVSFGRDGRPAGRGSIAPLVSALRYAPASAERIVAHGSVAMAGRAVGAGPRGPCADDSPVFSDHRFIAAWNGRIDNREELLASLRRHASPAVRDAAARCDLRLVVELVRAFDTRAFPRLLGAFAFVFFDRRTARLFAVRDPLGQRSISYAIGPRTFACATEDAAVLACPGTDCGLDERRVAAWFAFGGLNDGSTFHRGVKRVMPGHCLVVDRRSVTGFRYWAPDPGKRLRYKDPREYAEHYRELLQRAVACRTPARGSFGALVSGGLDSGPVAAIAARAGGPPALRAYTWAFRRYRQCDERSFVATLCDRYGISLAPVYCDDLGPLSDFASWPVHPHTPDQDPYRRFLDASYAAAAQDGCRVLLSGTTGDNLYACEHRWLRELIAAGRAGRALDLARRYAGVHGIPGLVRQVLLRNLLPRRLLRRLRPAEPAPWLSPRSRELLRDGSRWPPECIDAQRQWQCEMALGPRAGDWMAAEARWANRCGIEVRYPFRDRRIVEFMLSLPDHQLVSPSLSRPLLRRAVDGLLPRAYLERPGKTTFQPLFDDGLRARRADVDTLLRRPSAAWCDYVERDWVLGDAANSGRHRDVLTWSALTFELWLEQRPGAPATGDPGM